MSMQTSIKTLFIAALTSVLGACVSVNSTEPSASLEQSNTPGAELLLYRTSSLQAKLADAYVGDVDGDYFVQLGEQEYATYSMPAGWADFKVKAKGSVAAEQKLHLIEGQTTCVEVQPNQEDVEWLFVPFLNALVPSFLLKATPCPVLSELDKV